MNSANSVRSRVPEPVGGVKVTGILDQVLGALSGKDSVQFFCAGKLLNPGAEFTFLDSFGIRIPEPSRNQNSVNGFKCYRYPGTGPWSPFHNSR